MLTSFPGRLTFTSGGRLPDIKMERSPGNEVVNMSPTLLTSPIKLVINISFIFWEEVTSEGCDSCTEIPHCSDRNKNIGSHKIPARHDKNFRNCNKNKGCPRSLKELPVRIELINKYFFISFTCIIIHGNYHSCTLSFMGIIIHGRYHSCTLSFMGIIIHLHFIRDWTLT